MRFLTSLFSMLFCVTFVAAQTLPPASSRANLESANNSIFTANGVGAITGRTMNGWNASVLASVLMPADVGSAAFSKYVLDASAVCSLDPTGVADAGPCLNRALA